MIRTTNGSNGPTGPTYPPLKLPMSTAESHVLAGVWDNLSLVDGTRFHFINDNFELLELTIISSIYEEINSNQAYSYEGTFIATLQLLTIIVYNLDRREALPYDLIRRVALINSRVFNLSIKDYRLFGDALYKCIFELKLNRHSLSRTKDLFPSASASSSSSLPSLASTSASVSATSRSTNGGNGPSNSLGYLHSIKSPTSVTSPFSLQREYPTPSVDTISLSSFRTLQTTPLTSRKPSQTSNLVKTMSYLSQVNDGDDHSICFDEYKYSDETSAGADQEETHVHEEDEDDVYSLSSASITSQRTHIGEGAQLPVNVHQLFCNFYTSIASYLFEMDKYDPLLEFHERRDSFDTLSSGTELHTLSQTSDSSYWQHGPFVYSNGTTSSELPLTSQEVKKFAETHPVLTLDSSDDDDDSFDFINMFDSKQETKPVKASPAKRELRLFGRKRQSSFGTVLTRSSSKASATGKEDCVIA